MTREYAAVVSGPLGTDLLADSHLTCLTQPLDVSADSPQFLMVQVITESEAAVTLAKDQEVLPV